MLPSPSIVFPAGDTRLSRDESFCLSVRFDPAGFGLLLRSAIDKRPLHYRKYDFLKSNGDVAGDSAELFSGLLKSGIFEGLAFREAEIVSGFREFVLIPDEVYMTGEERLYLGELTDEDAQNEFLTASIEKDSIRMVWALPSQLAKPIGLSSVTKYSHCLQRLSDSFHFSNTPLDHSAVIRVSSASFEILAYRNGKLQLANIYGFDDHADFLYFLILALRSAGLDPENVQLYLTGELTDNSMLMKGIHKYIRNYYFLPGDVVDAQDDNPPSHFFFGL